MTTDVGVLNIRSVLVLEDDSAMGELLALNLKRQGYTVAIVPDLLTAHAVCQQQEPDVILVDLDLPRLGGSDFLREHRRTHTCHTRRVVLTSLARTHEDLLSMGVNATVPKPLHLEAFIAAIDGN